mmetsp:Transcript_12580/g.31917  ORF Transcript_12580/g.31917 Transcript_12580/m.31917 type:complete len:234 (+) Transcript_12580:857-1558(+)
MCRRQCRRGWRCQREREEGEQEEVQGRCSAHPREADLPGERPRQRRRLRQGRGGRSLQAGSRLDQEEAQEEDQGASPAATTAAEKTQALDGIHCRRTGTLLRQREREQGRERGRCHRQRTRCRREKMQTKHLCNEDDNRKPIGCVRETAVSNLCYFSRILYIQNNFISLCLLRHPSQKKGLLGKIPKIPAVPRGMFPEVRGGRPVCLCVTVRVRGAGTAAVVTRSPGTVSCLP